MDFHGANRALFSGCNSLTLFLMLLIVSSAYLLISAMSTYASWQVHGSNTPGYPRQFEAGNHHARTNGLQQAALQDILRRGNPLLGPDEPCAKHSPTCDWMARFPDDTEIVHLNIPGVHDAATGNYSDETQASLIRYTGPIPPASVYRCQQRSLLQMLHDGIRMFDMRIAYNPGNDTIGFYHSKALLAPTTTLSDVLFGFYSWLEEHPTETVLMSFNHEGGTGTPKDEKLQRMIFDAFSKVTDADPSHFLKTKYWYNHRGSIGTLGEARGKLVLLQRYAYDLLNPAPTEDQLIGIELGPTKWTNNGKNTELIYNESTGAIAFIQDYYSVTPLADVASSKDAFISSKFNVTIAHLERAISQHPDQLFINFASAAYVEGNGQTMYPRDFALGDETGGVLGMNQRLLHWLRERKGRRFGVILFDFYDAVPGLIEATIGLGTKQEPGR